jgi:hypothetical protein
LIARPFISLPSIRSFRNVVEPRTKLIRELRVHNGMEVAARPGFPVAARLQIPEHRASVEIEPRYSFGGQHERVGRAEGPGRATE